MISEMFDDVIIVPSDFYATEDFVGIVIVGGDTLEVYTPQECFVDTLYPPFEFYDLNDYVGGE